MKNISLFLAILLCLQLGSCRQSTDTASVLVEAETLMNERPDSALTLLKSIPSPEQLTGLAQARYALLYSQALDKNYIDTANDSLIQIAVNYYKDRDDAKSKFYAYYYLGRVHVNGNRLDQATLAFMNAEQEVEALGDDYAAGLLYRQMGYIYREYYDFPKALECYQQATHYFERAGKPQHKLWGMLSQSAVYDTMGQKEKAYDILCDILSEAKQRGETSLIKYSLGDLIMLCTEMGRHADAVSFYQEFTENCPLEGLTPSFYASLGILQAHEKNNTLAQSYLDKAWALADSVNDSIYLHHKSSVIYRLQQNHERAYRELEQCVMLQNHEMLKALRQPVLSLQKDFLEAELTHKQYRMKMERLVYTLAGVIFFLVAALVVVFLRKKLKKQEKVYEQKLADLQTEALEREQQLRAYTQELETKSVFSRKDIERLTLELRISKDHIEKSRSFREEARLHEEELRATFLALLNKLFKRNGKQLEDTFYELRQIKVKKEKNRENAIDDYIVKMSGSLYGKSKANKLLEELINEYYDNAMHRLRSEVKLPDEKHYQLVCMLLAGLSINFIASLTGDTTNAIYKRRDKIRETIKHSELSKEDVYSLL